MFRFCQVKAVKPFHIIYKEAASDIIISQMQRLLDCVREESVSNSVHYIIKVTHISLQTYKNP